MCARLKETEQLKGEHIYLTVYECVVVSINLFSLQSLRGEAPALTVLSTITCSHSYTPDFSPLIYTDTLAYTHTQPAKPQLLSSENKMPISTHLVLLFHSSQAICVNSYWPFSEWGRLKCVYRRQLKVKSNPVLPQVS